MANILKCMQKFFFVKILFVEKCLSRLSLTGDSLSLNSQLKGDLRVQWSPDICYLGIFEGFCTTFLLLFGQDEMCPLCLKEFSMNFHRQ